MRLARHALPNGSLPASFSFNINVNVSDIDVGVIANVQVPIAIAADVCGVAVNVLAEQLPGDVECEADAESAESMGQRSSL
jgi:hypothetical protein